MKLLALSILIATALTAQTTSPDVTGRWSGTADSTDQAGTKRQEKQTIEIRLEEGKLTAYRLNREGKPGAKMEVQQAGAKINIYYYLDFEGGEPLRWKLELKDGILVGTFSAQHHNPAKWIYDRIGAITMVKADAEAPK